MFFDLLHFGDGPQGVNYFIFCFFAICGTIQWVALRYNRHDLIWLDGQVGYAVSAAFIAGSFVWFFITDQEIFIPGLAGGELFTVFIVAFILAIPVTRTGAFAFERARGLASAQTRPAREKEPTI